MLKEIAELEIPYFEELDYIDIKNLCKANKSYNKLCNNKTLRKILYDRNSGIVIDPRFDIKYALDAIDKAIEDYFYTLYPRNWKYPAFIDEDALKDHIKRIIYDEMYSFIYSDIVNNYSNDSYSIENLFEDNWTSYQIKFSRNDIEIPFTSGIYDVEIGKINYQIDMPIILLDYIKESMIKYFLEPNFDEDRDFNSGLEMLLKDLLFIL